MVSDRAFKEVTEVRGTHKGGALIKYGLCPYKRRKGAQGWAHREMPGKGGKLASYCKLRREASGKSSHIFPQLDLGFQSPEL